MDRRLAYPSQAPLIQDMLEPQVNAMIALGHLIQVTYGTETFVGGLSVVPTSPASMQVQVGAGLLATLGVVDATAFGQVPADSAALVKMGINKLPTLLPTSSTFTPPASAGQSIAYLIQAELLEQDIDGTVLPYYNATDPSQPLTGPGNTSAAQNTHRRQTVALGVKPGAAATTGSQVAPGADAGWTPLAVVTLAYGDTSITSAKIAVHPQAPIVRTKLPRVSAVPMGFPVASAMSWTVPPGVPRVRIRGWGGGGGGGPAVGGNAGGAGGGGGIAELLLSVSPGDVITITPGAAGLAGTNGGDTVIVAGGVTYTLQGGRAGGSAGAGVGAGGLGGTVTGPAATASNPNGILFSTQGPSGGYGVLAGSTPAGGIGEGMFGSGQPWVSGAVVGSSPGGGGSGGANGAGAAGGPGLAIVEY